MFTGCSLLKFTSNHFRLHAVVSFAADLANRRRQRPNNFRGGTSRTRRKFARLSNPMSIYYRMKILLNFFLKTTAVSLLFVKSRRSVVKSSQTYFTYHEYHWFAKFCQALARSFGFFGVGVRKYNTFWTTLGTLQQILVYIGYICPHVFGNHKIVVNETLVELRTLLK